MLKKCIDHRANSFHLLSHLLRARRLCLLRMLFSDLDTIFVSYLHVYIIAKKH